jgi:hypothetical protein
MNKSRTTVLDRIILLFAGLAAGSAIGTTTGALTGLLVALLGGADATTSYFGAAWGALVGIFAGASGGFLLAIVYLLVAHRGVGLLAGALVGFFTALCLNAMSVRVGISIFLASIVAGSVAGYIMTMIFQRMDAAASRKHRP